MKVLVIEDNDDKLAAVLSFLKSNSITDVDVAGSYFESKEYLFGQRYDFVLLDMSIPVYRPAEGHISSMLVYGGEDLLAWAKRRVPNLKVIVITQFDIFTSADGISRSLAELSTSLKNLYRNMLIEVVHYRETDNAWQNELLDIIKRIDSN